MIDDAFDIGEEMELRTVPYILSQSLWNTHVTSKIDLNFKYWSTIKYLNDEGTGFHHEIANLPNNKGGLYLFHIRCSIIPGLTDYPCYIGRALLTNGQNLRKRCREYYTSYYRNDERPLITKMIKYWGKELFLSFIIIEENRDIITHENNLINSLVLPFNSHIPDIKVRQAKKAF